MLDVALDTVLDSFLPWQSIVTAYFPTSAAPPAIEDSIVEPPQQPQPVAEEPPAKGRSVSFSKDDDDESDATSEATSDDDESDDDDEAPPKIKLTEEAVDLGDLIKSLDVAAPPEVKTVADERVELTVPTDADTLVLKL
jgi:hypothetical protein